MGLHSHIAALFVFLAAPSVAFASGLQKGVRLNRITPELAPESDKRFFTKEYPEDNRPAVDRNFPFKHPYPAVQESINFDKDYIKDENGDGGKWNAQMTYDKLRNRIEKEKKATAIAKGTVEEKRRELEEATDAMEKAKKAADEAEKNTEKARKDAEETTGKVVDLAGENQTDGGAVGDAMDKVDKEIRHLEDCKKELAQTKEKLEKLTEEDNRVNRFEKEKAEHKDALKSYEKELEDVEQTEKDLKEAQSRLRRFRKGGESEPVQKSGAVLAGLASAPALIAVLAVAATSSFSA